MGDETAACAFVDALLTFEELGLTDVAERLRKRWADVPDPTSYLAEGGRRLHVVPHRNDARPLPAPSGEPI